jgi:hypothetical protein
MDSLLHKRHGFAAEHELRLLKFDEAHFSALVPKDASVSELSERIYVDWVLSDVIDKIIISPYAEVNYEDLVRDASRRMSKAGSGGRALRVIHLAVAALIIGTDHVHGGGTTTMETKYLERDEAGLNRSGIPESPGF